MFLINKHSVLRIISAIFFWQVILVSCQQDRTTTPEPEIEVINEEKEDTPPEETVYVLPELSLSNWKVTLPIAQNGKLIEVTPPEIIEYATNETLLPFMYNDSIEGALVFYTFPESTTPNSSYSRTELREQMVPGSNSTNWTFADGGKMKGALAVSSISQDATDKYHRTIIMQIHGRLTNAQRDLIGEDDNNAPPVLKIYWQEGKIRVITKKLKDLNATDEELLHTDAWEDHGSYTFDEEVAGNKFTIEVIASKDRLEVILNNEETIVYDDIHMEKWGVFENYFKAGNYLQTRDEGAFATVKFYDLEVTH